MSAQNWKGMSGAEAWLLIWRNAEDTAETNEMMQAWADANRPEWISVSERPPENGQSVIFMIPGGIRLGGVYKKNDYRPGIFAIHDVGYFATHWQPMPEPPK